MAAKKKATTKKTAAKKAPTKSEIFATIAEQNDMTRKEVAGVFDSLNALIKKNIGARGPGIFSIPGLLKIKVTKKPATKARKGTNPFTGEEMMFKAKPARKVVKALPLKNLKDMV